jgi:sterol desaturase/sphingolipid hydroxylase (fatty acid hydroxylase superfamily)
MPWLILFANFGIKEKPMPPFPINVTNVLGQYGAYLVFLAIGFFFGYTLEIAGFAKSNKLAAQFYFKDLTVLKVMFTAIIVAMVGIFLTSAIGLLDYNLLWVNPTYLWPGIIGGLIMGVGFILGGF